MLKGVQLSTHLLGFDSTYEDATVVAIGAPFDGTTSNRPGTRFAPNQMRLESHGLETYSPYLDLELEDYLLCDAGDIELPLGNTPKCLDTIFKTVSTIVREHKKPLLIGGEHLVSLPAVKALYQQYPDLIILHFDAHTDLREEYLGEKLSHATALRNIWELVGDDRIFQFGIRSGTKHEFLWANSHTYLEKFKVTTFEEKLATLKGRPLYLTIDLDVLDPSVFPGTGTPEAGGISMEDLLKCLVALKDSSLVGADLVELSPPYDTSGVSTAVACKILREVALLLGNSTF